MARRILRWKVDHHGKVTDSDRVSKFFGTPIRTREDYIALVHPDDRAYIERKMRLAIDTGVPYRGTVRMRCGEGRYRIVRWEAEIVVVEGRAHSITGTITSLGPCEHDRVLWPPAHFTDAEE